MRLIRLAPSLLLFFIAACASVGERPGDAALAELTPTAKLRFGIVYAPEPSTFFVRRDAAGKASGVTVDLANELARSLGRPVEFFLVPNSGEVTDALAAGKIDAAFMPVDDERRKRVDFGPTYAVGENTYLVSAASGIKTLAEVDRAQVRVIGISGTTTIRTATRVLRNTAPKAVASVDESLAMLRDGRADAFALTHDTLASLAPRVPGSRILDGSFNQIYTSIAVPKNRPNALAYVSKWLDQAKASGVVQKVFDQHGLTTARVPAAGAGR